jgi:hypothetical protein
MTKEEIKKLSKKEIEDLLVQNTKELRYDAEALMSGYDFVFNQYLTHRNFILEEKQLWDVILLGFFQFEGEIIDGIEDALGWYNLMVWCFNNLKQVPEINYYFKRYYDFHKERLSTGEVLSSFITTFVDDMGSIDLESFKDYASNLSVELSKLPEMVKNQLK